jgi:hypothetical protein
MQQQQQQQQSKMYTREALQALAGKNVYAAVARALCLLNSF